MSIGSSQLIRSRPLSVLARTTFFFFFSFATAGFFFAGGSSSFAINGETGGGESLGGSVLGGSFSATGGGGGTTGGGGGGGLGASALSSVASVIGGIARGRFCSRIDTAAATASRTAINTAKVANLLSAPDPRASTCCTGG